MLLLLPVNGQSPPRTPSEPEARARQVWDKLLTKCGESYLLYLPSKAGLNDRPTLWQYKGVTFDVVSRSLSPAKRSKGTQWEGIAVMRSSVFRFRTGKRQPGITGASYPRVWDPWRIWGDGFVPTNAFLLDMQPDMGDPPNVIWMKKEAGKWWFWPPFTNGYSDGLSALDEIARLRPVCADLGDSPAAK